MHKLINAHKNTNTKLNIDISMRYIQTYIHANIHTCTIYEYILSIYNTYVHKCKERDSMNNHGQTVRINSLSGKAEMKNLISAMQYMDSRYGTSPAR